MGSDLAAFSEPPDPMLFISSLRLRPAVPNSAIRSVSNTEISEMRTGSAVIVCVSMANASRPMRSAWSLL